MNQQVVIITGAGSGIGRATAVELAKLGYATVLVGRKRETLEETAQVAAAHTLVIAADVTKPGDIDALVVKTFEHFGRIDAVVNNAGYAPLVPIDQMTTAQWHEVLETNLSAAFYLCRAAWPSFKRQRHGVVVNLSSESARDPFTGFSAYGAAKAGLNIFGLALAREGAAHNIRVHTIAPGAVETPMLRKLLTTEQYPSDKALAPDDLAQVIARCIQGDLRYASGEVIYLHKTV